MALRAGYYGIKKKILEKVNALPGIKTIGTGLSLSSAGVLSATGGIDYSTTEQDTGIKWIDGKTIYKKTIVSSLPNATEKYIPSGISDIDTVIKLEGFAQNESGGGFTLPSVTPAGVSYSVSLGFSKAQNNSISLNAGVDRSTFTGYLTIYYTKI